MPNDKRGIERQIAAVIKNYPTLYGTNEHARMKVLAHMYFSIGGGYEWVDGGLRSDDEVAGRTPRKRVPWGDAELEARTIRCENDHVPHIPPGGINKTYSPVCLMPADVRPVWKELTTEVLDYFIDASIWHFPKYGTNAYTFSHGHAATVIAQLVQIKTDFKLEGREPWIERSTRKLLEQLRSTEPEATSKAKSAKSSKLSPRRRKLG